MKLPAVAAFLPGAPSSPSSRGTGDGAGRMDFAALLDEAAPALAGGAATTDDLASAAGQGDPNASDDGGEQPTMISAGEGGSSSSALDLRVLASIAAGAASPSGVESEPASPRASRTADHAGSTRLSLVASEAVSVTRAPGGEAAPPTVDVPASVPLLDPAGTSAPAAMPPAMPDHAPAAAPVTPQVPADLCAGSGPAPAVEANTVVTAPLAAGMGVHPKAASAGSVTPKTQGSTAAPISRPAAAGAGFAFAANLSAIDMGAATQVVTPFNGGHGAKAGQADALTDGEVRSSKGHPRRDIGEAAAAVASVAPWRPDGLAASPPMLKGAEPQGLSSASTGGGSDALDTTLPPFRRPGSPNVRAEEQGTGEAELSLSATTNRTSGIITEPAALETSSSPLAARSTAAPAASAGAEPAAPPSMPGSTMRYESHLGFAPILADPHVEEAPAAASPSAAQRSGPTETLTSEDRAAGSTPPPSPLTYDLGVATSRSDAGPLPSVAQRSGPTETLTTEDHPAGSTPPPSPLTSASGAAASRPEAGPLPSEAPASTAASVAAPVGTMTTQPFSLILPQDASPVAHQVATGIADLAQAEGPDAPSASPRIAPARTMVLQLSPEGLGTLKVRLHVAGRGLHVHLEASLDATAALIERDRSSLSEALGSRDYRLQELSIASRDTTPIGGFHADRNAGHDTTSGRSAEHTGSDGASGRGSQDPRERPRREASASRRALVDAPLERRDASLYV